MDTSTLGVQVCSLYVFYVYSLNKGIEDAENITESGVSAGLLEVRPGKQLEFAFIFSTQIF